MSDVSLLVHIDPLSYTTVLYMSVSYLMVQNRCGTYVDACQTILYYCSDQCLIQFNYWLRHLVLLLWGWYHDSENIFIKLEKMIVYYPWPEFDCTCVMFTQTAVIIFVLDPDFWITGLMLRLQISGHLCPPVSLVNMKCQLRSLCNHQPSGAAISKLSSHW